MFGSKSIGILRHPGFNDLGSVLGAGASLLGASMSSDAASSAADQSAAASKYAADLQKQMYDQNREDYAPWRNVGSSAVYSLADLMGLPYQQFDQAGYDKAMADYNAAMSSYNSRPSAGSASFGRLGDGPFEDGGGPLSSLLSSRRMQTGQGQAPVAPNRADFTKTVQGNGPDYSTFLNSPGYQFRLSQGEQALDRGAAARGRFDSGAALKDLMKFNQGMASDEYGNYYNRMANLAGLGQVANNSSASMGTNYANSVGNLMMTNAANAGNAGLAGASAWSSGMAGAGNALGKAISNWGSGSGATPPTGFGYGEPLDWGVAGF